MGRIIAVPLHSDNVHEQVILDIGIMTGVDERYLRSFSSSRSFTPGHSESRMPK
jgi:hypothetical protein